MSHAETKHGDPILTCISPGDLPLVFAIDITSWPIPLTSGELTWNRSIFTKTGERKEQSPTTDPRHSHPSLLVGLVQQIASTLSKSPCQGISSEEVLESLTSPDPLFHIFLLLTGPKDRVRALRYMFFVDALRCVLATVLSRYILALADTKSQHFTTSSTLSTITTSPFPSTTSTSSTPISSFSLLSRILSDIVINRTPEGKPYYANPQTPVRSHRYNTYIYCIYFALSVIIFHMCLCTSG